MEVVERAAVNLARVRYAGAKFAHVDRKQREISVT